MTEAISDRLKKVHERALKRFDLAYEAVREERAQCLADRRFYSISAAQWEGEHGDHYANRPKYEFNKVHLAVIRIINEYRNNRVTVDFTPKDGKPNDEFADTCDGLYRADEKASTANEAYDNAFEEAVGGGFGAWRLRTCYEDEDDEENEKQRVRIEPIFDADSCVFFDPDSKRQDKADAKWCFVLTSMTPEGYREEYDDNPESWPHELEYHFDWHTPDSVYVAEYYEIEEKKEDIRVYVGLEGKEMQIPEAEFDADPQKADQLQATGFKLTRTRRTTVKRVHKYFLSGGKVLSDEKLIAGRCIPIVPVYGKRWVVGNVERCMGHVRLAKDAQRLANMLRSWVAEIAAKFDVEKPILTPQQIAGHAHMWAHDAIDRFPYLLINPMTTAEGEIIPPAPLGYTKAPLVPPATAALMQVVEQDLQDLLGNQQAGDEIQPNVSGKAIELIQNRLDMQTFIYMSNLAKGMKRSGEIWLSMMKDIAIEDSRRMKTVESDGQIGSVVINQPVVDAETSETVLGNDFAKASLDVDVDVAPSSSSQRAATVRALTGLASISADPETQQALILASIANVEGEGLTGVRQWARKKSLQIGTVEPTEEEQAELAAMAQQQQQPDPQAVYLLKKAQEAESSSKLKEAQTLKTMAETEGEAMDQRVQGLDAITRATQPPEPPKPGGAA